jgi:DNA-directed RNA polymerase subunit RPC12/RpoP
MSIPFIQQVLALLKEQEAKTGKWIEQDGYDGDVYYDCSACGDSWSMINGTPQENGMLYCPHCGAKMGNEVEGR